jgi:hypothetical protein
MIKVGKIGVTESETSMKKVLVLRGGGLEPYAAVAVTELSAARIASVQVPHLFSGSFSVWPLSSSRTLVTITFGSKVACEPSML